MSRETKPCMTAESSRPAVTSNPRRAAQVFRKLSPEGVLGALSISRSGGLERNTGVLVPNN